MPEDLRDVAMLLEKKQADVNSNRNVSGIVNKCWATTVGTSQEEQSKSHQKMSSERIDEPSISHRTECRPRTDTHI